MGKRHWVAGTVEIFDVPNPWIYVRVPEHFTEMTKALAVRGLVPITVTLGTTTWDTSLLPMGDGTHFVALNAKVRKAENIEIGNKIRLSFQLRKR